MAFSKSLQRGQIALSCEMCEETSEIKWKCLTCQSFMCSKCCKIHRKVKSSDKHDIVDLKDIALHSTESGKNPDFTNINCGQHKDQKCCLYCKVCEEVVCLTCITNVHDNTHKMVEISEGYQVSMSKVKSMNSEVEKDILKFTSDISKLISIRAAEQSHYMAQKEKILSHEKAVQDAVERHTKKLLSNFDTDWEILNTSLKDDETYAVKFTKNLEIENKALLQAINSNDANEVFRLAQERNKSKQQTPKPVKFQRLPHFVPGDINPSFVETMYGTLEEIKEQVQIQMKEQYTTNLSRVSALVSCDDGSLWISDTNKKIIQNVKLSHGSIHINKKINEYSPSMALTSSGDLLMQTKKDTNLQIIPNTTGKVQISKYSASPLVITAVHVIADDKIIVGARNNGKTFPACGPRQVVVMDREGRHEQIYKFDNNKKPLFTYPYKITTDKDNNIYVYVIDIWSYDRNGRVVVLEQRGGVRGLYTGHPDINDTDHPFSPHDLVTTPSDNVIVSDTPNNTLHILNNKVQCLHYLKTKQFGIERPWSLCIDNKGFLFIGCDTAEREPDNAKIHVIQIVNS